MLGQIINITVLKNPILTITHKTAHCTYGQACNPSAIVWGGSLLNYQWIMQQSFDFCRYFTSVYTKFALLIY